ncbi:polysaccharide pyruvyl transferase family protein [Brevibacterium sp. RIT 803]|uniref:polysaccharide pyruvyl transferase family protein n=1 Tax=Brevibacterium sp. RIT 803 TaxID=2810210 RepID=UPI00194E3E3A|nr:polysaccharide pyruvyl transferase family protein [Brevibacterium sp. RIT 803]MBM6589090.1 polysaccharide pyruvyl transferase family protein [Brevibacterium sp. RIT 803]
MPDLKLFHFDIPTWGNYGDKALFPVVRDAFRVMGTGGSAGSDSPEQSVGQVDFTSAAALRREVDMALVERINSSADAVVIGGGGLFLQDTNPNRLSGWQWKISAEALAAIEVPLIVYALGDNRFPGQPEFDELMHSHVSQVLDQSVFFGLRNTGSIESMTRFLGDGGDRIRFQPCPTSIAGLLYEPLLGRRPDPSQKVLAIQMLVHPRQQAAGYDAEVIHQATIEAARMLVAKEWTILSVPFHPDDAEVSRKLVAEVPEVEEVRLYGSDVGFFAGFDLFSTIPYVLGGRGHAQMIPFGVGSIPISLDLHAKLGYFAHDIGHPEFVVPVGPEGMTAESAGADSDGTGVSGGTVSGDDAGTDGPGGDATRRVHALAQRIVDTIEHAYAQGNDLQDDLASTRQKLFDTTAVNHADIRDALRPASGPGSDVDPRTDSDIRAEEFHLAAVAEAEEFSTAQTRELSKTRREHKLKLDDAATQRRALEAEREKLCAQLKHKETLLERQSAELDAQTTKLDTQTAEMNRHADDAAGLRSQLEKSDAQLRSVNDRTATAEAKVLIDKTAHGLAWRARRIKRAFKR